MKGIRYLLSIKELLDGSMAEQLAKRAYEKLDGERRRKLDDIKAERRYVEGLGAGLLLQLGVQEFYREKCCTGNEGIVTADAEPVRCLTVSQALSLLGEPIEVTYSYGTKGKPYFQDIPVFFNLSHSGDYVCCVFSEQEVGVDIQYRKSLSSDGIVRRFFAETEQKLWENGSVGEDSGKLFYRLWTRKEAYGKLTGEGIAGAASVDVLAGENLSVCWEDYEILDGYQLAVCKRIREKE